MSKFTVSIPLRFEWRGYTISGAAGATHRIPDALYDEFVEEFVTGKSGVAMPDLAWIVVDEASSGGAHPDLTTHTSLGLISTSHTTAADPHATYALDADLAAHEAAADPHAGYRLESADHTHASSGLQGGQVAYSSLTGTPAAERAAASTSPAAIGTAAVGVGTTDARADHVHATGAGTPSTQAFGDAAATGTGPAAAMTDHKHALPANPVTAHEAAGDPHTGYRLESADHTHATTGTQGGTVAHSALTGLTTGDPHTQYVLDTDLTTHEGAADPHTGYLKENDANYIDLTDGLATTLHSHAGGGDDARFLLQRLAAQQDSSATTPAKVTGLDRTLGVGTWIVEYFLRYRSSAAGTGVKFDLNHSGTVTSFVWWQYFTGLIATASDANADQDSVLAAGVPLNAFASRAKGTAGRGVTLTVDTANADMFMRIEALVEVTVSGDIQLYFGSEATGSTQSLMVGSVGRFTKVA